MYNILIKIALQFLRTRFPNVHRPGSIEILIKTLPTFKSRILYAFVRLLPQFVPSCLVFTSYQPHTLYLGEIKNLISYTL